MGVMLFVAGCSGVSGINGDALHQIEIIESEYYSNYPEDGVVQKVITNKWEFSSEWKKVHKGMSPVPELPAVDFTSKTVVLIMLDTKPTGGYSIKDIKVEKNRFNTFVKYKEVRPGNSCGTTQAITKPYAFVSIPSPEKPIQITPENPETKNCNGN
jgi:hypothetical protein